jgi:low affinity Fe/Cu permease
VHPAVVAIIGFVVVTILIGPLFGFMAAVLLYIGKSVLD